MKDHLMSEMEAKAYASRCAAGLGGAKVCEDCATTSCDAPPCRPGIRERVGSQLRESNRQLEKAGRLNELAFLLDKNPEVARILDLLDEVRG